ncbi:MAG: glycosyltransferase family 2 protein [Candidatus Pacebacteria bacterium]|nr:glycosyltransferase family 2 protein [Candidatus Paceibacterota bacterium]
MEKDKVGVILVNYKDYARRFLKDCRDSLLSQTYNNFQVYIIDNASSDESYSYLKNNYPEAKILKREDGSYSAANNLGAREAISDACKYLFICNMDTVLDKDCILELVKKSQEKEDEAILQAKIYLHENGKKTNKLNTLGNDFNFLGFGLVRGYGKREEELYFKQREFTYASGCALILTSALFEKIGGYNELFYMYHDDIELSLKARLLGHDIALANKAIIYHKYEMSRSLNMLYFMERNRLLTILLFYKVRTLVLILPALLILELGLIIYSIFNNWFKVKLKALAYFLSFKNIATIRRERRKMQALRLVSEKELTSSFVGYLKFDNKPSFLTKAISPLLNIYWQLIKKII